MSAEPQILSIPGMSVPVPTSVPDLPVGQTSLGNAVVVGLKEIWAH